MMKFSIQVLLFSEDNTFCSYISAMFYKNNRMEKRMTECWKRVDFWNLARVEIVQYIVQW